MLELGDPIGHLLVPMPYTQMQQLGDPVMVPPARNYWKSRYLPDLSQGAAEVLAEQADRVPSPQSHIIVHLLGGAVAGVPADATAYPHRDPLFEVNVQARWEDPADDDRHMSWARGVADSLAPFASAGSYVNTFAGDEPDAAALAYGANQRRLVEVKHTYDPTNLFRLNQNISPQR